MAASSFTFYFKPMISVSLIRINTEIIGLFGSFIDPEFTFFEAITSTAGKKSKMVTPDDNTASSSSNTTSNLFEVSDFLKRLREVNADEDPDLDLHHASDFCSQYGALQKQVLKSDNDFLTTGKSIKFIVFILFTLVSILI